MVTHFFPPSANRLILRCVGRSPRCSITETWRCCDRPAQPWPEEQKQSSRFLIQTHITDCHAMMSPWHMNTELVASWPMKALMIFSRRRCVMHPLVSFPLFVLFCGASIVHFMCTQRVMISRAAVRSTFLCRPGVSTSNCFHEPLILEWCSKLVHRD